MSPSPLAKKRKRTLQYQRDQRGVVLEGGGAEGGGGCGYNSLPLGFADMRSNWIKWNLLSWMLCACRRRRREGGHRQTGREAERERRPEDLLPREGLREGVRERKKKKKRGVSRLLCPPLLLQPSPSLWFFLSFFPLLICFRAEGEEEGHLPLPDDSAFCSQPLGAPRSRRHVPPAATPGRPILCTAASASSPPRRRQRRLFGLLSAQVSEPPFRRRSPTPTFEESDSPGKSSFVCVCVCLQPVLTVLFVALWSDASGALPPAAQKALLILSRLLTRPAELLVLLLSQPSSDSQQPRRWRTCPRRPAAGSRCAML